MCLTIHILSLPLCDSNPTTPHACVSGMLHLGILVENMRREGFEFQIGPPKVILKEVAGKKLEPFDEATVDVPEEFVGAAVDLFGSRKGAMQNMVTENVRHGILKHGLTSKSNCSCLTLEPFGCRAKAG